MIKIQGTTLAVTGILLLQRQDELFGNGTETLTIYEITDTETGFTGHVTHELAGRKRDITRDALFTDNPQLINKPLGEFNQIAVDWPTAYDYSTEFTPKHTNKNEPGAVPQDCVRCELAVDDDGWYWELAH